MVASLHSLLPDTLLLCNNVESVLKQKGLEYYSPMRHGVYSEEGTPQWAEELFKSETSAIKEADAVVAVYFGSNGDSNLKMHVSATTNIYLKDLEGYDFNSLPVCEYRGQVI